MLLSVSETADHIRAGKALTIAADEELLKQLPSGQWVGGTIPYFMSEKGGLCSQDQLFVNIIPDDIGEIRIRSYAADELEQIPQDAPDNGLSVLIIPATSEAHITYAQKAPSYPNLFMKPIIGWIAGVHLEQLGQVTPKIMNGETGELSAEHALVMHLQLPAGKMALINTVNLFEPGEGDEIIFEQDGFSATDCLINGEKTNFADYLTEHQVDTRYPLVADYCGAMINVSFQGIDEAAKQVNLYAPVFSQVTYKIAKPLDDYVASFQQAIPAALEPPVFACNCILNYLYSELEGKKTGVITGPMTFGEIAYQLLNQTLVYVDIHDV